MSKNDEFYVGYQQTAPPGLGRFLRRAAIVLLLCGAALAAGAAATQGAFGRGTFEFGTERTFTGILLDRPLPQLLVRAEDGSGWIHHPLVAQGKHGARPQIEGHLGEMVTLQATRIERAGVTLLELVPDSIERTRETLRIPDLGRGTALGRRTLVGEIVDAKCYLGVMKPGGGKPHRACASLCIRGGVPAALLARGDDGQPMLLLLADRAGEPVGPALLDRVAETVEVTGEVSRHGNLLVLDAEPEAFRRLERMKGSHPDITPPEES